mmetsp:Transcript_160935/g.516535  ORF Transcript_160935/g.516535 Transcript_160935/m.516535 type:complete len:405 (-) Transcript_160935:533-1747(-)
MPGQNNTRLSSQPTSHAAIALPGRVLDDIVHSDDHLRRLGGGAELRHLAAERLHDAKRLHVCDASLDELQAVGVMAPRVSGLQLTDQLLGVESRIVRQDHGDLLQGPRESLDRRALLARDVLHLLHNRSAHSHLRGAAAVAYARVGHGLVEHRQGIMERALGLIQDVRRGTPEHDGASLVLVAPRELDDLVLADHHLGNPFAMTELRVPGVLEGRHDVRAQDRREALGAIEVRVLNRHDTSVLKQLLGIVVDELTVDEHVAAVRHNPVDFLLHLLLLGRLNLSHGLERVHLDPGAVDFDLVGVHLAIRHHNPAILQNLWHAHTDFLFQNEALLQERVLQRCACLFQDLDVVQVRFALQTQNCVYGQGREMLLLVLQELGAQCGPRNPEQVLPESFFVLAVVCGQ